MSVPSLLLLWFSCASLIQQWPALAREESGTRVDSKTNGREAYVTILNGKARDLELSVRVLGQSLKETKSTIERVVLCTPDVTEDTKTVLKKDGWTIRMIEHFNRDTFHSDGSFNLLQVWTMVEYRRVVWIDPKALVIKNIDHLFKCGNFCAVFQQSNYFSIKILVIKPSVEELNRILSWEAKPYPRDSVRNILNNFYNTYHRLMYHVMFDANSSTYQEAYLRLSGGYEMESFFQLVNSHWYMKEELIYLIDYSMDTVHPVYWWTYPLIEVNRIWFSFRERLPMQYRYSSLWSITSWVPLVVLVSLFVVLRFVPVVHRIANHHYSKSLMNIIASNHNGWIGSSIPPVILAVSYCSAFLLVPSTMWPGQAWFLYGLWLMTFLCLFYAPLCYFLYMASSNHVNGFVRKFAESAGYAVGFVVIHVVAIWILYSVRDFHSRVMTLIVFMLCCSVYGHFAGKRVLRVWDCSSNSRPVF